MGALAYPLADGWRGVLGGEWGERGEPVRAPRGEAKAARAGAIHGRDSRAAHEAAVHVTLVEVDTLGASLVHIDHLGVVEAE